MTSLLQISKHAQETGFLTPKTELNIQCRKKFSWNENIEINFNSNNKFSLRVDKGISSLDNIEGFEGLQMFMARQCLLDKSKQRNGTKSQKIRVNVGCFRANVGLFGTLTLSGFGGLDLPNGLVWGQLTPVTCSMWLQKCVWLRVITLDKSILPAD